MNKNPEGINTADGEPDKTYETFYPAERFVELADMIIEKLDPIKEEKAPARRTAGWKDEHTGDSYSLIREQQVYRSRTVAGQNRLVTNYWLSHYSPWSPTSDPVARYALTRDGGLPYHIRMADEKGQYLHSKDDNQRAAKESIEILSDLLPTEAKHFLQKRFDDNFISMAGKYMLSHLAIVSDKSDPVSPIDRETAVDAAVAHVKRIQQIEKIVERTSRMVTNKDDPYVHAAVVDAITSKPVNGRRHSSYVDVDLVAAASKVAEGIKRGWRNKFVKVRKQRKQRGDEPQLS